MSTEPRLRVAFLDDHLSFGGVTVNLARLVPGLASYGIEAVVITSDRDDDMRDTFDRAGVRRLYYPFGTRWRLYDDRVLSAYRCLASFVPHVVVASHESTSFDLLRYAPPGTFRVAEVQTDSAWSYSLVRSYAAWLDAVEGVSTSVCQHVRETLGGHAVRVVRIFNGVDLPPALPPRDTCDPCLRILYIGRLVRRQKRVDRWVPIWREIVRRNLHVELTFVGEGPERERLAAAMEGTDRQKVLFAGKVPHERVAQFCRANDVIALVSDYEGLCIGLLEGMAHGLVPVVTAPPGEPPEMIEGPCGFCVPPDAPDAFVDVLERLQPGSSNFALMRQAAHDQVRDKFSHEQRVAEWAELIRYGAPSTAPRWPQSHPFLGPLQDSPRQQAWYYAAALRPLRRLVHVLAVACRGRRSSVAAGGVPGDAVVGGLPTSLSMRGSAMTERL